jgi:hypothetical protein
MISILPIKMEAKGTTLAGTIFLFVFLMAVWARADTKPESDADIAAALVGTWVDQSPIQEMVADRITYFAGGQGVDFIWAAGQPESTAMRIDTRWSVTNRILVLTSVKSSDTRNVPVGIVLKDRILSISSNQFVFEPFDGYSSHVEKKPHVKTRAKTGKSIEESSTISNQKTEFSGPFPSLDL